MGLTRITAWRVAVLAVSSGFALGVGAQNPPQQPPPQSVAQAAKPKEAKPRVKKVWTDDDLKSTRKPWDDYSEQKQAAEQAAPAAQDAASAPEEKPGEKPRSAIDPKTGKPYDDPDSPKALERELVRWEGMLKYNEQAVDDARREMFSAQDPDRAEIARKKLDICEQNIRDANLKVQELRERLAEPRKRNPAGAPSSSDASSSQPPSPPQQ